MVEQEIKTSHAAIVRLKAEIRTRQDDLLDVEAKLRPLVALLDVYRDLAIPAPERAQAVVPAKTAAEAFTIGKQIDLRSVATSLRPVAREAGPGEDEADYEPREVNFNQVSAWAAVRNLRFKSWDDLPAINKRREEFELPMFKRRLGANQ